MSSPVTDDHIPRFPLLLHKVVAEIRYADGIVYLDRCGSLTRDLQKTLGKGFEFTLPSVEQGELISAGERIAVRYGPDKVSVVQDAVEALARFTQVSTWTWQKLAESLDVTRKVTRCGLRFQMLFATSTLEEAEALLVKSELATETSGWKEIFGEPIARRYLAKVPLVGWKHCHAQIGVQGIEVKGTLSSEVMKFYPSAALSLDLDFVLKDGEAEELRHVDLRDSILRAWASAQEIGRRVQGRISQ